MDSSRAPFVYAMRGWPIIPLHWPTAGGCSCAAPDCGSIGKHPLTREGLKDASTSIELIHKWLTEWPHANWGLRTGLAFDVLDLDGAVDLPGDLPPGPVARTGRGVHRLFRPTGQGNRARFLPDVDWRGVGGYIVAPPSQHASGKTYRWITDPTQPIPKVPGWLEQLLEPPKRTFSPGAFTVCEEDTDPYGRAVLRNKLDELRAAPRGQRNHTLARVGFTLFSLVAGGHARQAVVEAELLTVAASIGLGQRETERTIASTRAGLQVPWKTLAPRPGCPRVIHSQAAARKSEQSP